mgnify:CR=1 FL=1
MNIKIFKNKFIKNIELNQKLAKFTWFHVGGDAEMLYTPENEQSLISFLRNKPQEYKIFVIGAGSNLLIRDKGIKGIILISKKLKKISIDEKGVISAQAGAIDAEVARFARDYERTGLEFLLGIPGTIGGGIKMNSGAFGSEFKDVLIDVTAINQSGELRVFSNQELQMDYRKIGISDDWIFCTARFKTSSDNKQNIENKMKKILNLRKTAQPTGIKTGGSTFKNPSGHKAWKLIDQAGCRGLKIGDAMISNKHCNFIVNLKNSSAQQIEELGEKVKSKVFETSGIKLIWEIKRVGIK